MASKSNNKKSDQSPKPTRKTKKIEAKAPVEPSNRDRGLTIVGIGASAGGLAALSSFFDALPSDTGMAFVVVTHLHPEHESHMAELLQRHTRMPTSQVVARTKVEPNQVYVIPPNRRILMTNTHLDTHEFEEPHGRRTPVDHFFRSMAQSGHSDPIAIILSGGGTDGSVGIKDVKEVGGLIMVQQPEDAEYDSMPRAALTTGLVDVILPARQLAEKLADYIQHRPQLPHDPGQLTDTEVEILQRILAQVHARTGHDFTQYKRSTILRRVERRMQLNGFGTLEAYLAYLRGNANEAQAMFNDILIGVTNFFRDRDSWSALAEQVIPSLFQKNGNGEDEGIRVWSIGCATGEEAYGIAILLFEEAARQEVRAPIQVFASDLDERSIAHAREGLYPAAIEADVSPERLERFFTREGEYYRIKRELRDAVLFTSHNVMRDPPFSRQDLIACRNVLIYLQRTIQDRVFDIFHYSLHPGGYLFLGSSESAEHLPDLFHVVDKTHRIYQAKPWDGERPPVPFLPMHLRRRSRVPEMNPGHRPAIARFMEEPVVLEEQHQRALESFGPPSIIVNERYAILHVSESAGRYLLQPKGPITGDLLTLVRSELQLELRAALFHAFEKSRATVSRPVNVKFNGDRRRVLVSVRPRPDEPGLDRVTERQALVLFIEDELINVDEGLAELETPRTQAEREQLSAQLQSEIVRLREQLQITVEEYESSNEEMKAANEELQSINEEYRSATEELETSKEELQSVNEELQTVNSEMRNKLDEVSQAHRELENLMGATDIATLYLDRELRIQRYTAGVQELFNILNVDRGRRISDLTHKIGYNQFMEDAEQVLRKLIPLEREVQRSDGHWFLMRLRPYRTMEDRIEGVVITFIDINELKETAQELLRTKDTLEQRVEERTRELDETNQLLRQARDLFYGLFNANPIPTALTHLEDEVFVNVNDEFLNYFNLERDELIGHTGAEFGLGLGLGPQPKLNMQTREDFAALIKKEGRVGSYETEITSPSGEVRNILASLQYIEIENTDCLITTFIDITDRVRAELQIRSLASELTATEQAERHRLSQILHDDLQQRIFAVQMHLSFLKDAYEKNDLQAFALDFPQLEEWLHEAIQVTRKLSVDLSPPILHGEGLVEAVMWLATQMQEQYGLKVDIKSSGTPTELDEKVRVLVFYALRELLFNIVKHAGILEAAMQFEHSDSRLLVIVKDDGTGFDSEKVMGDPHVAHGLLSIRHRLNLLGCSMKVISHPGNGTEVNIEVPYGKMDT
jgi:two-component system CheB/CheR fusion protein